MKKTNLTQILPISLFLILSLLLPTKAQIISDYCKGKNSNHATGDRVYYRVEKDLLEKDTWEIIGNGSVKARIRKETTPLGDEWKIESKLGTEIGFIDDEDFIRDLQRGDFTKISIEKDGLGDYIIRNNGVRVGRIKKFYAELYDITDDTCPFNKHYIRDLWNTDDKTTERYSTIPNPLKELRKQLLPPNPLEELKKDLDPFKDYSKPSSNYTFPAFRSTKPTRQRDSLLPDPMEELKKALSPWNTNHYGYSSPSFIKPSDSLFKSNPRDTFTFPSLTDPFSLDSHHYDNDEW